MKTRVWLISLLNIYFIYPALAEGAEIAQRQHQLATVNSQASTVISTMQDLLQGYEPSTLTTNFAQEITHLTHYAKSLVTNHIPSTSPVPTPQPTVPHSRKKPKVNVEEYTVDATPEAEINTNPDITGF